jgi:hypothetical protein
MVYVEWLDSSLNHAGWQAIDDPVYCEASRHQSVGFLFAESDSAIMLIPHLAGEDHPTAVFQGFGNITIPRCAITRMVRLAEAVPATTQADPQFYDVPCASVPAGG